MKVSVQILLLVSRLAGLTGACSSCEGEGSTCKLVSGLYTKVKLSPGYNHITTIPVGACAINITLLRPSSNRLALGVTGEEYFINSHGNSTPTGLYSAAGSSFSYFRGLQHSREQLQGEGPITKSLNLQLLVLERNRGVEYRYMFPMEQAQDLSRDLTRNLPKQQRHGRPSATRTRHARRYSWTLKTLTVCSASCGGGYQTTVAVCIRTEHGKVVPDSRCSESSRPVPQILRCNRSPCPPFWSPGPWGPCSATCGYGVQERKLVCQRFYSSSLQLPAPHKHCGDPGSGLITTRRCSLSPCEPEMLATQPQFSPNSSQELYPTNWRRDQSRSLVAEVASRPVSLDLLSRPTEAGLATPRHRGFATSSRPGLSLASQGSPGTEWAAQPWGSCSVTCGAGVKERRVHCVDKRGGLLPDSRCEHLSRPVSEEFCSLGPCVNNKWLLSDWDSCSAHCGEGVRQRRAICLGGGACLPADRPATSEACRAERTCAGEWMTGRWSVCSHGCGKGTQTRDVVCIRRRGKSPALLAAATHEKESVEKRIVDTFVSGVNSLADSVESIVEGTGHVVVDEKECKGRRKPKTERGCLIQECRPQWFTTDWSKCSAECGEGERTRELVCILDSNIANYCSNNKKPANSIPCQGACTEGSEGRNGKARWYNDGDDDAEEDEEYVEEPEYRDVDIYDELDEGTTVKTYTEEIEGSGLVGIENTSTNEKEKKKVFTYHSTDTKAVTNEKPATSSVLTNDVISSKPVKPGRSPSCRDKFKNCAIVVQSRLCKYAFYQTNCCSSCTSILP